MASVLHSATGFAMLATTVLLAVACGPKTEEPTVEDETVVERVMSMESDVETMSSSLLALQIGAKSSAVSLYKPLGCVTEERTDSSVTYNFAECTGPYEVGPITGTLTLRGENKDTGLTIRLVTESLRIGETMVAIEGKTVTTVAGRKRTTVGTGTISGRSLEGVSQFSRVVNKTITARIGDSCVNIEGHSTGTIGADEVQVEFVSGFQRCGGCPAVGSKLQITAKGKTRTVDASVLCAAKD